MKLCDIYIGLPHNSEGEVSAYNAVEPGSSPGLGRSSGELEEVMAIHTSILAWRISWSEDHGRLQSMGLQRVSHDWAIKTTKYYYTLQRSFPGGSAGKESSCNSGDPSLIPGSERSPGEVIGYRIQYSWVSLVAQMLNNPLAMRETWVQSPDWEDPLEEGMATHSSIFAWRILMGRGAWWATVHGVTNS